MASVKKRLIQDAERVNPILPVHIWRTPAGAAVDMLVVTHLGVYSCIHGHASESLPNETGGFLIGRVAHDDRDGCWHIEIEEAIAVTPETQDPVHFTFTWRDVDRVRSYREERGKALVGWYHTHPDLGIFLSETDLERTHRVLFSEPFQVALVYDPVRGTAGYFFWEGAQAIDASQAAWREFAIAVAQSPAAVSSAPAVAHDTSSESDAITAGAGAAQDHVRGDGDRPQPEPGAPTPTLVPLRPPAHERATAAPPDASSRASDESDAGGIPAPASDRPDVVRRRRVEAATDDTHAGLPLALVDGRDPDDPQTAVGDAHDPDTRTDVIRVAASSGLASWLPRGAWRLALEALFLIVGFALGYLWFGGARGLE